MTAFDYSGLKATAERLIERFGQSATLTSYSEGGDAWNPTLTPSNAAVQVAVFDYRNREIDGELILQGDKLVYLSTAGLTAVPAISSTITIGGVKHSIIDVMPLSPGGTAVMYKLQVRR